MTGPIPDIGDDQVGALNGASGEALADLLVEIISRQAGSERICDLGCGSGYLASRLAERGHYVTGIDGSRKYIEAARARYASPRVTFEHAQFSPELARRLAADPFDLVLTSDVIEHLYRPADLIETAYAALKPNGTLVLCTPFHGYFKNVAIAILGRWDTHHGVHWDGGHIKFFSVATLTAAVLAHGFVEPRFFYYGRIPVFAKNMICVARRPA